MRPNIYLFSLLSLSLVIACGESEPSQPDDPIEVSFERDFPEVWGAPNLEDEDTTTPEIEVSLRAEETTMQLGSDIEADMYAYNGHVPGPIIQAGVGDTLVIDFQNELDEATTIHWHGLRISDEMDGSPRIQDPVEPGESFTYTFEVDDPGSFWFHPHVRGHEQIERGLYGLLIVRDEEEPTYDRERYLTVDDIFLDSDGEFPEFPQHRHEQMHGRAGNALFTNGTLDVVELEAEQGDIERWRLVNPANARTTELSLEGASWRVIATDGGPLPEPYETDRLTMAVGQRYDLEIVFEEDEDVVLNSHVLVQDENGEVSERALPLVEVEVSASDRTPDAVEWPDIASIPDREPNREEDIEFDVRQTATGGIEWLINGEADRPEPLFEFTEGDTVRFHIRNEAGPEHPFHLHGQFFTVVDGALDHEPGLKDSVLVPGQESVEIIAYFDNPGRWMAHCHILEHIELGMMSEIVVEPAE